MDFFQLREFTMLVKTLNYGEAAFRLNVSSSALSRHIQFLESELGEKLFVRTTRSIAPTEFGKVFLPHAVMMLQDYNTCIDALTHFKSDKKPLLTLDALTPSKSMTFVIYFLDLGKNTPLTVRSLAWGTWKNWREGSKTKHSMYIQQ